MDKLIFQTNVFGFIFVIVCTIFVCFFLFAFCEIVSTIIIVTVYVSCLFNRIFKCSCCNLLEISSESSVYELSCFLLWCLL